MASSSATATATATATAPANHGLSTGECTVHHNQHGPIKRLDVLWYNALKLSWNSLDPMCEGLFDITLTLSALNEVHIIIWIHHDYPKWSEMRCTLIPRPDAWSILRRMSPQGQWTVRQEWGQATIGREDRLCFDSFRCPKKWLHPLPKRLTIVS